MSSRGKKSNCTIAGHTLTWAELTVLKQIQSYVRTVQADLPGVHSTVDLREVFSENAKRYAARRLSELGVLKACRIELLADASARNHKSSDLL